MSRDTTRTLPKSPTREEASAQWEWRKAYFEGNWEPQASGGFENSAYGGDGLTQCKSCGALVMQDGWDTALNLHRSWHDRNDRD